MRDVTLSFFMGENMCHSGKHYFVFIPEKYISWQLGLCIWVKIDLKALLAFQVTAEIS